MRITFNAGRAGKVVPGSTPTERFSLGYYWWYWLPDAHTNGGRLHRNEVVDCTVYWLCFWMGFTLWP